MKSSQIRQSLYERKADVQNNKWKGGLAMQLRALECEKGAWSLL
jgi:hypothetical protein